MQNNIIYDNEKNIYIFGMICDTKNEEDVTYLKVRPFLMDGPNDMRTIRCTFDAKKAAYPAAIRKKTKKILLRYM